MRPSRTIACRLDGGLVKRLVFDEPVTAVAIWARRAALFALILAVIAVATIRFGAVEMQAGMAIGLAAVAFAALVLPLTAAAMVVIWNTGRRGSRIALSGLFVALALLAYPSWLIWQATRLPGLHDVSTDTSDPPDYSRSEKAMEVRAGRVPGDASAAVRAEQLKAYPDIQPITVNLEPEDAYDLVVKTAGGQGWKIVDASPPGGRMGLGHLDAVARSFVLGLPEDVTVRITPLASQTRIDVRSSTRFLNHDLGLNAARIRKFAAALLADPDAK